MSTFDDRQNAPRTLEPAAGRAALAVSGAAAEAAEPVIGPTSVSRVVAYVLLGIVGVGIGVVLGVIVALFTGLISIC